MSLRPAPGLSWDGVARLADVSRLLAFLLFSSLRHGSIVVVVEGVLAVVVIVIALVVAIVVAIVVNVALISSSP